MWNVLKSKTYQEFVQKFFITELKQALTDDGFIIDVRLVVESHRIQAS